MLCLCLSFFFFFYFRLLGFLLFRSGLRFYFLFRCFFTFSFWLFFRFRLYLCGILFFRLNFRLILLHGTFFIFRRLLFLSFFCLFFYNFRGFRLSFNNVPAFLLGFLCFWTRYHESNNQNKGTDENHHRRKCHYFFIVKLDLWLAFFWRTFFCLHGFSRCHCDEYSRTKSHKLQRLSA